MSNEELIIKRILREFTAIMECVPITKIPQEKLLSICWVPVSDYFHIFQCYQYGRYGHIANECKSVLLYVKCSSPDHCHRECDTQVFK